MRLYVQRRSLLNGGASKVGRRAPIGSIRPHGARDLLIDLRAETDPEERAVWRDLADLVRTIAPASPANGKGIYREAPDYLLIASSACRGKSCKVLRSGATEFRYERDHQPIPRIGPWQEAG